LQNLKCKSEAKRKRLESFLDGPVKPDPDEEKEVRRDAPYKKKRIFDGEKG
jgi:hypothetical protein